MSNKTTIPTQSIMSEVVALSYTVDNMVYYHGLRRSRGDALKGIEHLISVANHVVRSRQISREMAATLSWLYDAVMSVDLDCATEEARGELLAALAGIVHLFGWSVVPTGFKPGGFYAMGKHGGLCK